MGKDTISGSMASMLPWRELWVSLTLEQALHNHHEDDDDDDADEQYVGIRLNAALGDGDAKGVAAGEGEHSGKAASDDGGDPEGFLIHGSKPFRSRLHVYNSRWLQTLAEAVGFEPTEGCPSTVFKTAAFNHSATPPHFPCATTMQ